MKRLITVIIVILLCGCSPQRRLARLLERFPPDTSSNIEYRTHTVYRDTGITRYLPGEIVTDSFPVRIPFNLPIPDTSITLSTSLATSTAWLEDNVLGVSLQQYDSLFQFLLDSAIRENRDTIIITKTIPYPVIEKVGQFWKHGFIVLAVLIVVGLVLFFLLKR
jgi:hypothetical protein